MPCYRETILIYLRGLGLLCWAESWTLFVCCTGMVKGIGKLFFMLIMATYVNYFDNIPPMVNHKKKQAKYKWRIKIFSETHNRAVVLHPDWLRLPYCPPCEPVIYWWLTIDGFPDYFTRISYPQCTKIKSTEIKVSLGDGNYISTFRQLHLCL